ncbi:MAG: hypothetical protein ACR2IE_10615 [Candidatus Sumerlaeaceae bacterium]
MISRLSGCAAALLIFSCVNAPGAPSKVTFDENGVLQIDGRKEFVISFSIPPPPGGKTPDGKDGWAELKEAGTNFFRIAARKDEPQGGEAAIRRLQGCLDAAAQHGMHCWVTMNELPSIKPGDTEKEQKLRAMIARFKDHPGLGAWKGYDEPAWVKMPHEPLVAAYKIFKEMDPHHPVIIIQAPTKASLPLEPYAAAGDVFGVDIYPVAYPPGRHSDFGNRELSVVSDCTKWIRAAVPGKPTWMTLQVAWGGVASTGKRLRFPSFHQQRYMAYAAVINGARGLNWQGPALPSTLNETDAPLEWNWTYWRKVQKALVEELGVDSRVNPALVIADSKMPVKVEGADDVEFCVREVGDEIFVLAAKREGETAKVKFTGLTIPDGAGAVLFEEPQKVQVRGGTFEDWFAPNDVHVYCLKRRGHE